MKKNKKSKNWIIKQKRDIYVKQSKLDGYRSRAAYKLLEINQKYKIVKNGMSIVDLGSAPGSWSQYVASKYKNLKLLTIDLKNMENINNSIHIQGDFTDIEQQTKIKEYFKSNIDFVMSDMAANTTGNKNVDSLVTGELCLAALNFACEFLKKEGSFVSKIFMGTTFNEIVATAKKKFKKVNIYKPPSSRKDSKESFIICQNLR